MSQYNIEIFLNDFANRTIDNLKYIEDNASQYNLYELTQLINSMLGLLIIPVEKYKNTYKVNDKLLKEKSSNEYEIITDMLAKCMRENRFYSDYERDYDRNGKLYVSNFINHIRNAIAHGGNNGIHFYPISESGNIQSIIFYDSNEMYEEKDETNEFCIELNVSELKTLVHSVSDLYCKFEKKEKNVKNKVEKYNTDISKLHTLLTEGRKGIKKGIFEPEEN